jgi:hypothetical protein
MQRYRFCREFPNDSEESEFVDNMITIGALNFEYSDKVVARFLILEK